MPFLGTTTKTQPLDDKMVDVQRQQSNEELHSANPHVQGSALPYDSGAGEDGGLESLIAEPHVSEKSHWFIIHPEARWRRIWDLSQVFILCYVCLSVPVFVGLDARAEGAWFVLDMLVDVYFYLDIILNLITGYKDDRSYCMIWGRIVKRYICTWMIVDVLSSLPVDLVIRVTEGTFACSFQGCNTDMAHSNTGQLLKLFKVLRFFRLIKLLRMVRVARLLQSYQDEIIPVERFLPVIKQVLVLCLLGHLTACAFYFFSSDEFRTDKEKAAIASGEIETWIERQFGVDMTNVSTAQKYVTSLYWSFTTLTTVGYGDIVATTVAERTFALIAMVFGTFFFGFTIATCGGVLHSLHRNENAQSKKLDNVLLFAMESKLPKTLRRSVLAHMRSQKATCYSSSEIIRELPGSLRRAVVQHVYDDVIQNLPEDIRDHEDLFIVEFCIRGKPMVFQSRTTVFSSGQLAEYLFFMVQGEAKICKSTPTSNGTNGKPEVQTLVPGDFFGTESMTRQKFYVTTVHTSALSKVWILSRKDAGHILRKWAHIRNQLAESWMHGIAAPEEEVRPPVASLIQNSKAGIEGGPENLSSSERFIQHIVAAAVSQMEKNIIAIVDNRLDRIEKKMRELQEKVEDL